MIASIFFIVLFDLIRQKINKPIDEVNHLLGKFYLVVYYGNNFLRFTILLLWSVDTNPFFLIFVLSKVGVGMFNKLIISELYLY